MSIKTGRIVLVDDDPGLLRLLSIRLRSEGYEVRAVDSAAAAIELIPFFKPGLVITDLRMEHTDGLALLEMIQRSWPGLPVVLITAHGSIPDAVAATRNGAFGFLTKPVDKAELLDHVARALRLSGTTQADESWREGIVSRSAIMTERLAQARLIAQKDSRILITGASGTGKGLLAEAIHKASQRAGGEFASVNCSAMPENLLESELFGHRSGSFDGADTDRVGLFRHCDGGTLLLDEIADMPVRLQVKLLRFLEEGQIRPVGTTEPIPVNVRIVSATRYEPETVLSGGRFREDLFYRLSEASIELPPLSQRRSDIPLLATHFLREACEDA